MIEFRWTPRAICGALMFVLCMTACNRTKTIRIDIAKQELPAAHPAGQATETNAKVEPPTSPEPKEDAPAEKEELFEDWGTPAAVLLITGQQRGFVEPCGCTGLANQKGGLARRHTFAKELAAKGWPLAAIDAGNQVRRFGRQAELKFQITAEALKTIGYQAIGLGTDDLRLSVGEVAGVTMAETGESPFVCANAAVLDRSLTPRQRVIEVGGKRIGVTAVLSEEHLEQITSSEVVKQSPAEGLGEVVPELKKAECDLYVLLAHASIDETKALARQFPDFDVVVSASGHGDPGYAPEDVEGTDAILIRAGIKGMFVGVVGLFEDDEEPLRYQRVPLDARFEDSSEMLELLSQYQDQLKDHGLDGLGLSPIQHPSGNRFVGSQACADCHTKAFAIWEKTKHAKATDALAHPSERIEIPRHFDPECLSCHVTGWHAQRFFPYTSGYLGLEATPALVANGCENCHGPGSAHVAAERGEVEVSEEMLKSLQQAMRLPLEKAEDHCRQCHDLDNDPDFQKEGAFDKDWPKVEHKGLD